jgi:hypothetical protein
VTTAYRRVLLALGFIKPTDPDGYRDYEVGRTWNFRPEIAPGGTLSPILSDAAGRAFPAIEALDKVLADVPADTPVIVLMPPQFYTLLPAPGSHKAIEFNACKAELASRVGARARGGFLDYLTDTPIARNPENFMDAEHYRANVARAIEKDIAAVLAGASPQPVRAVAQ